jgi:ADP-ribosylation factor related protein 1
MFYETVAKIRYQGAQIIFWDLGGQVIIMTIFDDNLSNCESSQARMRSMWEKYYLEANAVIFVVDSADVGRLDEAKVAFGTVL